MAKKMHLTGFMLFAPAPHMIMSWVYPREKIGYQWYEPEYWETIAKTLERGKFAMFFFADPAKVHRVNFQGQWYKTQGPLTVIPSPQRRPYLFQAGQSERGQEFAARHAECIFAAAMGIKQMRKFCDDIAARVERHGRDPATVKIIWGAQPLVAKTTADAREHQAAIRARIPLEASLVLMSGHFNYDLTTLNIDTPLSELNLEVSGTKGLLDMYRQSNPHITLREIAGSYLAASEDNPLIGAPEQVADYMQYLLEEGGGDGFQITPSYYAPDYYEDLVTLLIPVLQRRGTVRTEYTGRTLRDYMTQE